MKKKYMQYLIALLVLIPILYLSSVLYQKYTSKLNAVPNLEKENMTITELDQKYSKIILAGGCFWCTEADFSHSTGIVSVVSGYADSEKANPTYEEVSGHTVKAREAVLIHYDPKLITIEELLAKYWRGIDPTDAEGSFADRGHQYTSAIYYFTDEQKVAALKSKTDLATSKKFTSPIATEILAYTNFYPAEEYHQDYKDKNPVRYNYYREGSGRNDFIKIHWQDGTTTTVSSVPDTTKVETVHDWKHFTFEDKEKRLKELTPIQIKVTQEEGTERPFQNEYNDNKKVGLYVDIVSGEPLFLSTDKFDSGTGWPSFVKPVSGTNVTLHEDNSIFNTRVEVRSKIANSHLGHVFDDGPAERGGKRYCMNSAALRFIPVEELAAAGYSDYVSMLK